MTLTAQELSIQYADNIMHKVKNVYHINNLQLVSHVYRNEATFNEYRKIPFIRDCNGQPDNLANMYILELIEQGKSVSGRGGTVSQYAYVINRFGQFIDRKYTTFTGEQFSKFAESLRSSTAPSIKSSENTAIANTKIVFDFIAFLEEIFALDINSARLNAKKIAKKTSFRGITKTHITWHHGSFGAAEAKKRRSAIEDVTIEALRESADNSSDSVYVVRRRRMLIDALEFTGARIGEISEITVQDVLKAAQTGSLMLTTLKRRGKHLREIPILSQDISDLMTFLRYRQIAVRRSGASDDGKLFFSEKTGKGMDKDSLSNEIGMLRRSAGISESACAHLFRHRFVTRVLIRLISEHGFQNPMQFREALQEMESLKAIACEWTGHASTESLNSYIDTAFSEWKNMSATVNKAFKSLALDSFEGHVLRIIKKIDEKTNLADIRKELAELKKNLETDRNRDFRLRQEP